MAMIKKHHVSLSLLSNRLLIHWSTAVMLILSVSYPDVKAQNQHVVDSLVRKLGETSQDTIKANILYALSKAYWGQNPEKGMEYANQCFDLSQKIGYKRGMGNAFNGMGIINYYSGEYLAALEFHNKAMKISEEMQDTIGVTKSLNNIGIIYQVLSKYPEALKNYFSALKLNEGTGNKAEQANNLINIAGVYMEQNNFDKAMQNSLAALKIRMETGDRQGIAGIYTNIGVINTELGNYKEALKNGLESIKIKNEIGDIKNLWHSYNNIGLVYHRMGNYQMALKYYSNALKIAEETDDLNLMPMSLSNIGIMYSKLKRYDEAFTYLNKGLSLSIETGNLGQINMSYEGLATLDSARGNYKQALDYYKKYISTRDSMTNEENLEKTVQIQMQYDFDKKQMADSIRTTEERKVISAELKQEQTKNLALYGGVTILLLFGGFIYNRFRITKNQKNIIENQKEIVEEKNREITQSIKYALRIQSAILPRQKLVKEYLDDSFILYKPKDIVAGDFYWMETKDDVVLFAACDCTGHGVPGAMVSVVCHNALNRAVREFGLIQPAAILDKTAEIVIENFSKSEEDIKDGMDISLCAYHIKTKTLEWAGANNPLWIVRKSPVSAIHSESSSVSEAAELIETKGDKQPIGMYDNPKPFLNHQFTLLPGDCIYLFTDGFADQFGGESGNRKLTRKRFRNLILSLQNQSMQEQGIALDNFIATYRKDVEQIDDILVMGVKV